jgi:hypothetical protein
MCWIELASVGSTEEMNRRPGPDGKVAHGLLKISAPPARAPSGSVLGRPHRLVKRSHYRPTHPQSPRPTRLPKEARTGICRLPLPRHQPLERRNPVERDQEPRLLRRRGDARSTRLLRGA